MKQFSFSLSLFPLALKHFPQQHDDDVNVWWHNNDTETMMVSNSHFPSCMINEVKVDLI